MKNFDIVCLHVWERSWLDKMRTVELNPWTLDRSTNPKERTRMPVQFNSAVRMIGSTRNASKSPTTSENLSTVGLPTRHHSTPRDKKSGSDETKQSAGEEEASHLHQVWWKGPSCQACSSGDDCQDVDEVGTEPSSDVDSDLFGLDWGDDPIATINSMTQRNERTRGGKESLAFVDSGAVDNVLPKSMCTEYPLEATSKSQSGVVLKEQTDRTRSKHNEQRRCRVNTSAGSNMNTTWDVADVRKPLISASRLVERGHKLVLDEKPRIQCQNGDTIPLERTVVLFAVRLCGFRSACTGRAETQTASRNESLQDHTLRGARETRMLSGLSTDASDRADVDMDEPVDPDGLGREVTDTVGTARVLVAPRTPTNTEREEHDVSHVPHRPWCRFCVTREEDWRDVT